MTKKRTIIWISVTSEWQSEATKKINDAKSKGDYGSNMQRTCNNVL